MDRIFPRFFLPPGPIAPEQRRFFSLFNYCAVIALAIHGFLIPVFALLGAALLTLANVVCVGLWLTAIRLNRNGRHRAALFLGLAEIAAHSTLATVTLGASAGFHFYLLLAAPLVFFHTGLRTPVKVALVAVMGLIVLVLYSWNGIAEPWLTPAGGMLRALAYANIAIAFTTLSALSYYYNRATIRTENKLRRANERLEQLAHTDPLTGLMNRRCMMERISAEAIRADRTGRAYSVVLIDVDNFKTINDHHGHAAGDRVLVALASLMGNLIRRSDWLARWGGEEFLLLLPETDARGAREVAEKLRTEVANTPIRFGDANLKVTLTLGVCVCRDTMDHCIVHADHALYEGKRSGKNRTVFSRIA